MKIKAMLLLLLIAGFTVHGNETIRINQIGYYPDGAKVAIYVGEGTQNTFQIIDHRGEIYFSGTLSEPVFWAESGEHGRRADFSKFNKQGMYRLKVGSEESWPFTISGDLYRKVSTSVARSYYLQRASLELDPEHAGIYARKMGHPDTKVKLHKSTSEQRQISAPGGWYDAGDFGKYIVSAGITTANFMTLLEWMPSSFPDKSLNIPESGNAISDLLDEVSYELAWFKTMQDSDGGVFTKLTTETYPDMMFPHEDPLERFVFEKSTAATLHFSAVMAMYSRIMVEHDSAAAEDALSRAEKAWKWALQNDNRIFKNPKGVLSGDYSNDYLHDEFFWAATELYISSGKSEFLSFIENSSVLFDSYTPASWAHVYGLAIISMNLHKDRFPNTLARLAHYKVESWAESASKFMANSAYHLPEINFVWGSNSDVGALGMSMAFAFKLTGNKTYLNDAIAIADYVVGKNAVGYSFVTGHGDKQVKHLHHSVSIADGIELPLPGFIPGGPNKNQEDGVTDAYGAAAKYDSSLPAKSYVDSELSYASNENDICYSAPNLVLFSVLDQNF